MRKRMEKDRHPDICNTCRNYRRCVAFQSYCPAYGIAYNYHFGGYVLMKETERDLAERRGEGWAIRDLCVICHHRCKLKVEDVEKFMKAVANPWVYEWDHRHCPALVKVAEIPCPVYWGKSTDVKEGDGDG